MKNQQSNNGSQQDFSSEIEKLNNQELGKLVKSFFPMNHPLVEIRRELLYAATYCLEISGQSNNEAIQNSNIYLLKLACFINELIEVRNEAFSLKSFRDDDLGYRFKGTFFYLSLETIIDHSGQTVSHYKRLAKSHGVVKEIVTEAFTYLESLRSVFYECSQNKICKAA